MRDIGDQKPVISPSFHVTSNHTYLLSSDMANIFREIGLSEKITAIKLKR